MRVVMFSTDASVIREGSPANARMEEYKKLFDELHVVLVTGFASLARSFFAASRIIKKNPMDCVVSSQEEFTGVVCCLLKLIYGVPWQAQIHTDIFSPYYKKVFFKNRLHKIVFLFIIHYASCIRVVGERVKTSLVKHGIRAPIIVLPIYTDLAQFQGIEYMPASDYFRILTVSRLTREKNTKSIVDALAQVPKAMLTIVGDGPERKNLEERAKKLNVQERVEFVGEQKDLARYFAEADCFVLASWYEGFGLAALEAMAAGLSVVMSNVGMAGDILKNGITGSVFEPGDLGALVRHIEALQADIALRKKLGENARRAVAGLPSKDAYLLQFKKSLELCKS